MNKYLQREIDYQKNLNYPKIVKVKSYFEDENNVYFIEERVTKRMSERGY